ncbi:MAG: protein kinase [bacterium]|nr:protein kinase [bacterium]
MKSNHNRVGTEPIPGYVLRKRLGAGGYGEVWLADAPGGLQKAVKLVFGSASQSHALTELKSLQRIKEVNHPFLLSLERIEIVDDQVIIITELAEGSLLQKFEHFRRKSEPGIPRGLLLEHLHDTAEGLDYLEQSHGLQHLDVKPGNLLLIANRVKVADFGLVKDLNSQNQSLVSGLTPNYSAPEIFDGRPNSRSDQYSLAIVYMEMLTGQMPFSGRSTGELARQHLTQPPDLEALPPADRPVVARALAKNPNDRFSTCRQFIEQLQKVRGAAVPQTQQRQRTKADSLLEDGLNDVSSTNSRSRLSSTDGTDRNRHNIRPAIQVDPNAVRDFNSPRCLFIGLGGLGCQALWSLRKSIFGNCDARLSADEHGWLAIDTVSEHLSDLSSDGHQASLASDRVIRIPIYKPSEYRSCDADLLKPISRRWLYNIPKSLRTEGVRPLATLAMLDHYAALENRIRQELSPLLEAQESDKSSTEPFRIYVTASLHGGTGGGMLIEFGRLIRQIMTDLGFANYRLTAAVTVADCGANEVVSLPAAAALASLSELRDIMETPENVGPIYDRGNLRGSLRPFDWVTIVDGGSWHSPKDAAIAARDLADTILIDSQTMVGSLLTEDRIENATSPLGWLRTASTKPVRLAAKLERASILKGCAEQVIRRIQEALCGQQVSDAGEGSTLDPWDIPEATSQAMEEIAERLLSNMGLAEPCGKFSQDPRQLSNLVPLWQQRLCIETNELSTQLHADLKCWKRSIGNLVKMRIYDLVQLQQIQHIVIDKIRETKAERIERLIGILAEDVPDVSHDKLRNGFHKYLSALTKSCSQWCQQFQLDGEQLAQKLDDWSRSLAEERGNEPDAWDGDTSGFASDMQLLIGRLQSGLESALQQRILSILVRDPATDLIEPTNQLQCSLDQLERDFVLEKATDIMRSLEPDFGLALQSGETMSFDEGDRSISCQRLGKHAPGMARFGGQFYRFALAPREQLKAMFKVLKRQSMTRTTTLLPCMSTLRAYIVCEGLQPSLSRMVSSFCHPTPQTIQLAERLHTRVDVEWSPIGELFEIADSLNDSDAMGIKASRPGGAIPISVQATPSGSQSPLANS